MESNGTKTLICRLKGGLGNQLFQYACALNLARRFGMDIAFDTAILTPRDVIGRQVEINKLLPDDFREASIATAAGVVGEGTPDAVAGELARILDKGATIVGLDGYFQKEDFFLAVRPELKARLAAFRERLIGTRSLRKEGAEVVGLHLRRHDYQHLGLCSDQYYAEAIDWFVRKYGRQTVFYVLTDEPLYTSQLLTPLSAKANILVVNTGDHLQDLLLLSTCDHFVIANSTYSWWAAYLGEQPSSVIFAPTAPWILNSDANPVPARWCGVEGVVAKHEVSGDIKHKMNWARFASTYYRFQEAALGSMPQSLLRPNPNDLYPCLDDEVFDHPIEPHYTYHTAWAARKLVEYAVPEHYDFGSSLMFSTIASAFTKIVFHDFRAPQVHLSGLTCRSCDLLKLEYPDNSLPSVSCMHTIEHIGLGRYGDTINPLGDRVATAELVRVLKPGGLFFFVVPVGRSRLQFNAHRIYSLAHVMELVHPLVLVESSLIPDNAVHVGMVANPTAELVDQQIHGCGCFVFRKPPG